MVSLQVSIWESRTELRRFELFKGILRSRRRRGEARRGEARRGEARRGADLPFRRGRRRKRHSPLCRSRVHVCCPPPKQKRRTAEIRKEANTHTHTQATTRQANTGYVCAAIHYVVYFTYHTLYAICYRLYVMYYVVDAVYCILYIYIYIYTYTCVYIYIYIYVQLLLLLLLSLLLLCTIYCARRSWASR